MQGDGSVHLPRLVMENGGSGWPVAEPQLSRSVAGARTARHLAIDVVMLCQARKHNLRYSVSRKCVTVNE